MTLPKWKQRARALFWRGYSERDIAARMCLTMAQVRLALFGRVA
jgi:hypothetical protein